MKSVSLYVNLVCLLVYVLHTMRFTVFFPIKEENQIFEFFMGKEKRERQISNHEIKERF